MAGKKKPAVKMPSGSAEVSPGGAQSTRDAKFPIVGIGASAGGLAAFEAFFSGIPTGGPTDVAWVLVQHLSPDHKSILCDLLKRHTRMRVHEVEDGMVVRPDCAYIIPPNCDMALLNGSLQLLEPVMPRGRRMPIDFFFRSLAGDQHERAICVVLSGSGSDGTLGARAVKGEGGLVLAQSPETAEYDSMPSSLISTGLVDYVLAPAEMPHQIISYLNHAFRRPFSPAVLASGTTRASLGKICIVLRDKTGHDFSQFKENTIIRRVERRMALHQIDRAEEYLRLLQGAPEEVEALFRDLLIGVTNFFRDPEAFGALETQAIPRLFDGRAAGTAIRVWVCGCSTGEEAYSIAILIQEQMDALGHTFNLQVFATDVDREAVDTARSGLFPDSVAADISPERLARWFTREADGGYRIHKSIRDQMVFSEQDVIRDPPFSKLDMISCRNLMIYMNGELQRRLLSLFHYALRPGGVLFLGTSETVGENSAIFRALDRKWRLYRSIEDAPGAPRPVFGKIVSPAVAAAAPTRSLVGGAPLHHGTDFRELTEQALLRHFAQVGVLVDERGKIQYIHGRTGKYLEPAPGDAAVNILEMARDGLRRELTVSLHRAVAGRETVRIEGLQVRTNGDFATANLTVTPLEDGPGAAPRPDLYLVILEEPQAASEPSPDGDAAAGRQKISEEVNSRISALERELKVKNDYLLVTLEEMETSNEELKSVNEEAQSVNEELQSTNEELETSKEELQSVNEELATVNAELQTKVNDLSRANNDMNNLLAGTGVATLFVDTKLRITRFTPGTSELIHVIRTDVGRPVAHLASNFVDYESLVEDVQRVLDSLVPHEAEIRTRSGSWFLMRLRPYRTLDNVIEGAVITFVDITDRKHAEDALQQAYALAKNIISTVREPLVVLDDGLEVVMANPAYFRNFGGTREGAVGRNIFEIGAGRWDIPELRRLLEKVLSRDAAFEDFRVPRDPDGGGPRMLTLNARRLLTTTGRPEMILLAFEDPVNRHQGGSGPSPLDTTSSEA